MQDQRLVNRLQNYWDLIRRSQNIPDIGQLNVSAIDDLWQQCMKVEIIPAQGGVNFAYRFVGESLIKMLGQDITNRVVDRRAKQYPYSVIVKKLDETIEVKKIIVDENQIVNEQGRIVKYRACFMPFGNETKGITHIVIGFSDRTF